MSQSRRILAVMPGDDADGVIARISLIPVFISLDGFVSHFLFRRELQGICFAIGLTISQVLNELVKTNIQQSHPDTCKVPEACDSHDWPSSHSQYMFFFVVYFSLLCLKGGAGRRGFLALVLWSAAVLMMYSRVYLGYHSIAQVFARAILGQYSGYYGSGSSTA